MKAIRWIFAATCFGIFFILVAMLFDSLSAESELDLIILFGILALLPLFGGIALAKSAKDYAPKNEYIQEEIERLKEDMRQQEELIRIDERKRVEAEYQAREEEKRNDIKHAERLNNLQQAHVAILNALVVFKYSNDLTKIINSYEWFEKCLPIIRDAHENELIEARVYPDMEVLSAVEDEYMGKRENIIMCGIQKTFENEFEKTRSVKSVAYRIKRIEDYLEKIMDLDGLSREHIRYAIDSAELCVVAIKEIGEQIS